MRRTEETDSFLRDKVLDFTHLVLGMRTGVEDEHKRAPLSFHKTIAALCLE